MSKQSFKLIQSYHLWFEIFDKPFQEGLEASITSNYDYEIRSNGKKRVYIDIGIKLNRAYVVYRSGFEFKYKALTWKEIFNPDTVHLMLQTAFDESKKGYKVFCDVNSIENPTSSKIPEALLLPFANTIIEQYTLYRSITDEQSTKLKNLVLEGKPGLEPYLLLTYTFDILGEVLFYNSGFNKEHNRQFFEETIPFPRYFTLKHNCKMIEFEKVSLFGYDMVQFFQCLDCALQMLMGNKSDMILSVLERQGFDTERQADYIKFGTDQLTKLNILLKQLNVRIINLEERVDWLNILN